MFVRVAIPIPSPKTFTYAVPETLAPAIAEGKRVLVPFGKRRVTGFIVEAMTEVTCHQTVKEILELPDPEPLFDRTDLAFFEWISRYYLHPLGKVLSELLPGGIDVTSGRWLRIVEGIAVDEPNLSSRRLDILRHISSCPSGLLLSRLRRAMGANGLAGDLAFLETAGLITSEERLSRPAVRPKKIKWAALNTTIPPGTNLTSLQSSLLEALRKGGEMPLTNLRALFKSAPAALHALERKGFIRLTEKELFRGAGPIPEIGSTRNGVVLNQAQTEALEHIRECLAAGRFAPCLLHGVTGSGKTEVYLQAIADVLERNGGAIYLVPEIALTKQLVSRVASRFPEREIAVLHSGISQNARYDQWKRIRRGEIRMVVGARSALFAPVQNLRLIVVDEEHDPSYKQDERLCYNARDLALVKSRLAQATVVLGSATPSIQSYYHAVQGRYRYLTLPSRIDDRPLPRMEIVDMREERDHRGLTPLLSRSLIEAVRETLARGKQTLLFLNRRGFHTFLFCPECGYTFACPNCEVALTHHSSEAVLKCHHCDFTSNEITSCPKCRGRSIRSHGAGTERIEEETKRLFPQARIARMDSDTTSRKGDIERILRSLDRAEIDILIGTQMITKGHDFPGITLVGVMIADASLNIPDFRAAERTFQILTQVAGRGGRGDHPGRVVIQSFNPAHYALCRAKEHDYAGFYADELPLRRQLSYPPFSRLVGLHFSSLKKNEGKNAVAEIGVRARELAATFPDGRIEVIGPAESPLSRIRGRYRWQLLIRGTSSRPLHLLAQKILAGAGPAGLEIRVDVDPVNFM